MIDQAVRHATGHLLMAEGKTRGLQGSRCNSCGEYYFPAAGSCTRCCGIDLSPRFLGNEGVLWSWTVQGFLPKSPYNSGETAESFQPYGVGYIELPCGLKVESRLSCADPAQLKIGMPMRLVETDYGQSEDQVLRTFAFAPADSAVQEKK